MELKCKLKKRGTRTYKDAYDINNQVLIESKWNKSLTCTGKNIDEESSRLIRAVFFNNCVMKNIPKQLNQTFPNLELLSVNNCGLQEITRDDLKGFAHLKHLLLRNNELMTLPGDLFLDNPDIEQISFKANKLLHIGHNILDPLIKLQSADFRRNLRINTKYSVSRFMNNEMRKLNIYHFNKLRGKIGRMIAHDSMKSTGLKQDIENFLSNDDFKDFTVKIDDKRFLVHKFILAARSPVMNALMKQEPDADEISLIDISIESFEKILDFVYDDKFPNDDFILETYAAAALLEILELKEFTASRLISSLNNENALNIFTLADKYKSDDLKQKAFNQIKSLFPDRNLKDELASNPEAVKKLIAAMNEIVKLTQE